MSSVFSTLLFGDDVDLILSNVDLDVEPANVDGKVLEGDKGTVLDDDYVVL